MARLTRLALSLALFSIAGTLAQAQQAQLGRIARVQVKVAKLIAHVYVGSGSGILAFSATQDGQLEAVPGSPFNDNLSLMGANGRYLFGFEPSSVIIDSFSIAANGALKKAATTDTQQYWPLTDCPLTWWNGQGLRIDHSGQELYNAAIPEDLFCYSTFQSYSINNANGQLTYQTDTDKIFYGGPILSILGNNDFAYSPNCAAAFGNGPSPSVTVFQRVSNGQLDTVNASVPIPAAPDDTFNPDGPAAGYYCPITTATDPANHLAMTLQAVENVSDGPGAYYGPVVIAVFTADTRGNLATTSTYQNMATIPVDSNYNGTCLACATLRMAPSGDLLAAGGTGGVVLYHFNGGSQATMYKSLLAGDNITQILWDNTHHMYALGSDTKGAGKLWVFTVTPTSVTEAPGSPHSIPEPGNIVVQPFLELSLASGSKVPLRRPFAEKPLKRMAPIPLRAR